MLYQHVIGLVLGGGGFPYRRMRDPATKGGDFQQFQGIGGEKKRLPKCLREHGQSVRLAEAGEPDFWRCRFARPAPPVENLPPDPGMRCRPPHLISPVLDPGFNGLTILNVDGPVVEGNFVGMVWQGKVEGLVPPLCLVAGVGENQGRPFRCPGHPREFRTSASPGVRPRERCLQTRAECF